MDFRQEFEKQLEEIYLGKIKDIKGDGGYINLINIKSQFYNDILKVINNCERDLIPPNNPEWTNNDQRDYLMLIYEHIFTFFSKYLNDTGTPFYSKVKSYNGTYAPVYKDDDVSLFWKTQDLYYVKSEKLFDEMSFEIDQTNYYFNVDELKRQTSNEKLIYKFFIDINDITVTEDDNGMKRYHLIIKVLSNKTDKSLFDSLIDLNTDKGLKEFKKEYLEINKYYGNADEKDLIDAIRKYQRQSDIDYFIHKNAKSFLEEQLDLYMYNALGKDMITEFTADLITRYQHIRILASTIIDYIARFENELKSMWEKPKLVKNSNYIITLDKLSSDLVDKLKSESPNSLKDEWIELGFIDNNWTYNNITEDKYKTLPIDTKHLSSTLKYDILASFDDLEKYVDGVLIKSDNYQALQTLQAKYNSKIDYIYIDPPYNAPVSEVIYRNGFKHSTWLTMMENRISQAKSLLTDTGIFTCAIDENEQERLGLLLEDLFPENKKTCITIEINPRGQQSSQFSYTHDYAYFIKNYDLKLPLEPLENTDVKEFMKTGKESERNTAKNCFYPIYVKDNKIVGFGNVCDDNFHPQKNEIQEDGIIYVYPISTDGTERKWRYSVDTIESIIELLEIRKNGKTGISILKRREERQYRTVWYGAKHSATEYGSKILNDLGLGDKFDFPKSIYTVKDSIHISTNQNKDSYILDFFGGSGTTAHSTLMLNDEDNGNRKYILVEMGNHFYNAILPRIKKLSFAKTWKKGKPADKVGYSQFVKYYELESYDDVLTHAEYKQWDNINDALIWDEKLSKALVFNSDNTITFDFSQIGDSYQNFADEHTKYSDIAETLSNLFGADIIKLDHNKLYLKGIEGHFDMNNLNFADEKTTHLKKLVWWESI